MTYKASSHCGSVSATIEGGLPDEVLSCNCSICRRKGHLLHFVPTADATIEAAEGKLADYTFARNVVHHHFCAGCGCSPFGRGADGNGNPMVSINLRCVPECDLDALHLNHIDGASF